MSQFRFAGLNKGLATNTTQSSLTLTSGPKTGFGSVVVGEICIGEYRGVKLWFFGAGSATNAGTYQIWLATPARPIRAAQPAADFLLEAYGSGAMTLGSQAGAGTSTIVTSSDLMCDTLTWTIATSATSPSGPATIALGAYALGTETVYSGAANKMACLFLPNVPGTHLVVELAKGTMTSANFAWELTK